MHAPSLRLAVLVVDDCPDTADSLAALLGLLGYDAEAVHCGVCALERMAGKWFDVVVLDLAMPRMSGCEVARRLPGRPWRPFLIAVTGWATEADRHEAAEVGVDLLLDKLTDLPVLDGVLRRVGRFLRTTVV